MGMFFCSLSGLKTSQRLRIPPRARAVGLGRGPTRHGARVHASRVPAPGGWLESRGARDLHRNGCLAKGMTYVKRAPVEGRKSRVIIFHHQTPGVQQYKE